MPASTALTDYIRQRAAKLEKFYDRIGRCDVVVDAPPHKHEHIARRFSIRIDLAVPGQIISVHRDPTDNNLDEDIYVTVNKAFHTLRRRLEDFARIQRGQVKASHGDAPNLPDT